MSNLRAAALAALAMTAACTSSNGTVTPVTPSPAPIQNVVILVQENRSLNNLFAGYPGAQTAMSGPCKPDPSVPHCHPGVPVPLHPVTLETTGTPGQGVDLAHGHAAWETEYDGGKMDGFNLIAFGTTGGGAPAGLYPYAVVERREIKPYWDLAGRYVLADHMFSTDTTDSFVAHQMLISGTVQLNGHESLTDTPSVFPWGCDASSGTTTTVLMTSGQIVVNGGPYPCFTQYKTMADVLDAKNVSWKYYVEDFNFNSPHFDFSGLVWDAFDAIAHVRCARFVPPEACSRQTAPDWSKVAMPNTKIFSDLKNGSLPQVSWVIPALLDSDHPAAGSNTGPSWVSSVINAIGESKYWNHVAIVVVWDDWGGFYDNVSPPQLDYTSLGFRVPMLVVSPYAKHGAVSHTQYEFGSILKFVEQTFGTASLGSTDVRANSIVDSFDFSQKPAAFVPLATQYPASYFLRPRKMPSALTVIEHDGGVPE
jgi:phospholipase C